MSEIKEEKKESKNYLTEETVIVKYVMDHKNGISDKAHPLYGGLSSNASIAIPAPLLTRRIEKIFEKEELEFLGKELNEDLSPNSDFWREYRKDEYGMPVGYFPIYLKKEGMFLKKNNALDYIKIRILEDSPIVAKNPEELKLNKSSYRFVLINHSEQFNNDLGDISTKKKAYKLHSKYEKNEGVLRYLLKCFNKNVSYNNKLPFLQKETWKLAEVAPELFVKYLEDDYLDEKVVLDNALRYKLVSKVKGLFYTSAGDPIRLDGDNNDYTGAAKYLASGVGQDMKLELQAMIKSKD